MRKMTLMTLLEEISAIIKKVYGMKTPEVSKDVLSNYFVDTSKYSVARKYRYTPPQDIEYGLTTKVEKLLNNVNHVTDGELVNRLRKRVGKDVSLPLSKLLTLTKCQNCGGNRDVDHILMGDIRETNICEYCGNQYLRGVAIYLPEKGLDGLLMVSVEADILSLEIREECR